MRSVTSCFNATLYKKDLSRFWPLWALYTVIWLFMFPLNLFSQSLRYSFDPVNWAGREPITMVAQGGGLVIAVGYGLICAAAVWSYLYNNRSANLMHALPVRREGHFLTHTLAGITFFVLPHLIIFVLTLVAELFCGAVNVGVLATALAAQTLMCLFFFCFATLCAMLTGHILGLPAFYAIFNLIVLVMANLVEWLCNFFLYGYTGGLADSPFVRIFTPAWLIGENVHRRIVYEIDHATGQPLVDPLTNEKVRADYYAMDGMGLLAILAIVGVVMLGIALLLYRRRHMETAGDTVSVPALRPVFLYCMGICGSLAGGCLMYLMFDLESLIFLVIALMIWGVIFYFAGMMLLHKSFRVFKAGWWGCGVTLCVVLALCGCLQIDLFGAEARVPDAERVESVGFSAFDTVPYDRGQYIRGNSAEDPETIAKVIAVHQAIVDDRKYLQNWEEEYADNGFRFTTEQEHAYDEGLAQEGRFSVTYNLKNGSQFSRNYNYLWLEYGSLGDPTSLEHCFTELANDRTILAERYGITELAEGELLSVALTDSGTHNCVFLAAPGSKLDFDPPYYYPEQDDEFYFAVLQNYGFTREELESDPMLMEKLLADPEMTYMVEDYLAGAVDVPASIQVPVPTVTKEQNLYQIPYGLVKDTLTEAQAEAIRQAVLDDFYAGNLGVRYLFNGSDERQDNTFVTDLELTYSATIYEYYYDDGEQYTTKPYSTTESFKITLTPQAKATIAALKAAGAFAESGVELRTNSGTLYHP